MSPEASTTVKYLTIFWNQMKLERSLKLLILENGSFREVDSIYGDFCDAIQFHLIVKDLEQLGYTRVHCRDEA